jgi:phage shock protein C
MDPTTTATGAPAPTPPTPPTPPSAPMPPSAPPAKRLYRSRSDRMVGGVLGGMAVYLGIDATILRLLYAGVSLFTGLVGGALLYLIAMIVIPEETLVAPASEVAPPAPPIPAAPSAPAESPAPPVAPGE